jgi:UDP-N-acetylmuramate dehydrogenase
MKTFTNYSLKAFNTFGLDVSASQFIEFDSVDDLCEVLKTDIIKQKRILVVGQGSNLLFLNDFDGVVLHSGIRHTELIIQRDDEILLNVGSGVIWDELVEHCVKQGWWGIENLSLIPGETGSAAVQNIGAYGVELCDVIHSVYAIDCQTNELKVFPAEACGYGYRQSNFKSTWKDRYIITSVVIRLSTKAQPKLSYQHLEEEVGKAGEITLGHIRQTIIRIRESKLPDPKLVGNAGSFFMNPVVSRAKFNQLLLKYPQLPHYFISDSEEKIPAGWLIEQAGWKGKSLGNAAVHDKQALVLINKGNATGSDIALLASMIQKDVEQQFGITLNPEVIYIN